ncbi:MAG: TonB-dependent receptor [Chlorobiaceae bacterium]|nr:TonB-dependent receptor [Chlorobiaceae bacterium]
MKKAVLLVLLLACPEIRAMAAVSSESPDTGKNVFTAGEILVNGKKHHANEKVTSADIEKLDKKTITQAANLLPGVNITNVGGRNEGMIYVRGFDMRQVPLYLDGIPQYLPYDGYMDPNRFVTFNLSEITVAKGYSSVLYGPNTLGGAINLVTGKPEKTIEGSLAGGMVTGREGIASQFGTLKFGSNLGKWYIQGTLSAIDTDFWPLSKSFDAVTKTINNVSTVIEDGGKRDNARSKDISGGIKVGYTPNATDEYTFAFNGITSDKDVPVYTGSNAATPTRYWKYSDWDKASFYYIGKTVLSGKTYLKTRAYYDLYYNVLDTYTDKTYSKISSSSVYDDTIFGGSVELGTEILRDNLLKIAVLEKRDIHKEYDKGSFYSKGDEENTLSLAAENTWTASPFLTVIAGIRQDFQHIVKAEDYTYSGKTVSGTTSFPLKNNQATNYQLALVGHISENQELTGYVARTTRFPTQKDRYSYKNGKAIPNPELIPEKSWNYGLDYSIKPSNDLKIVASLFQSSITDVIQQVDNVSGSKYQLQNTGKATFTGCEISADWQPVSWLKGFAGYSYIERENKSNPNLCFTDVPKHKVNAYLQFFTGKNTWIIAETEFDSKRYSTSDGKYTAGGYTIYNLRANAALSKSVSAQVAVENLFDRNYAVAEGYPEPGRQIVFALNSSF